MRPFLHSFFVGLCSLFLLTGSKEAPEVESYNPVAEITSDPDGTVYYDGEVIVFSGEDSDPTIGYINEYLWWYREGTSGSWSQIQNAPSTPEVEHTFPALPTGEDTKTYQIRLFVRNNSGYGDFEIITVTLKRYPGRVYFVKDHLGSVRVTVDVEGEIVGFDDYYPFGLEMPGHSESIANPKDDYKFTGFEEDDEAGLSLYHANARGYDPVLGRFNQVDPMQEFASPYVYAGNNPVSMTDPTGMSTECNEGEEEEDCRARQHQEQVEEDNQRANEDAQRVGAGWAVGTTAGQNAIKNTSSSNKEDGANSESQPESNKVNFHNLTDAQKVDMIISYLKYLRDNKRPYGDVNEIFSFINESGENTADVVVWSRKKYIGRIKIGTYEGYVQVFWGPEDEAVRSKSWTSFNFAEANVKTIETNKAGIDGEILRGNDAGTANYTLFRLNAVDNADTDILLIKILSGDQQEFYRSVFKGFRSIQTN